MDDVHSAVADAMTRRRPVVQLTLAPDTRDRLDEIARRLGIDRSKAAEKVILAAKMPSKTRTR